MRFSVKNLGPVKEASIDVRPMTIFVGPNNAGKTWTMQLWASMFSGYNRDALVDQLTDGHGAHPRYAEVFAFAGDLTRKGTASIDLVQCARHLLGTYFQDLCRIAPGRFSDYMASRREGFDRLAVELDIGDEVDAALKRVLEVGIRTSAGGREEGEPLLISKEPGESTCAGLMSHAAKTELPQALVERVVTRTLLRVLHQSIVRGVWPFPTERAVPFSGVFGPLLSRTRAHEPTGEEPEQGFPLPWPRPLVEALVLAVGRTRRASSYAPLASVLERKVLRGRVVTEETEGNVEHLFQVPRSKRRLEIAVSSSMVKELALIALYLRHHAVPRHTLCIDEPEMNLHPEAQAKLTEFLGILVNSDLNVMATTHAPYLVDHLSNLLKAGAHEHPDDIEPMFFLQDRRAFLKPNQVSVYLFEGGRATSIVDQDGHIDWGTFADVSDRTSNIHFSL